MKNLVMCGFSALLICGIALAGDDKEKADPAAKVNHPAPGFSGETYSGKSINLQDYKGKKIVVLEWFNHDCPVCRGHVDAKTVINMVEEFEDVQFIGIDSTFKHRGGDEAVLSFLSEKNINYPIINDAEGKIGRQYGAKTTPHMFVIDKEGVLRYAGAIDNRKSGEDGKNFVVMALNQIQAGETVEVSQTQPYGCSVKYKAGKGRKGGRRGGGDR